MRRGTTTSHLARRRAGAGRLPPGSPWLVLLLIAAAPLALFGLDNPGFNDNEGMFAEIARGVYVSGDLVTTSLAGVPYLNKPPLLAWMGAAVYALLGVNEWVRVLSAVSTLGTAVVVSRLAARIWPGLPGAGVWAAGAYLTSALTLVEAHVLRPDTPMTLLFCAALLGAVRISERDGPADRTSVALLWGGMALMSMLKGFLGPLLPALAFLPALALAGRIRDLRRYCPAGGILLFLAIVLPWHLAAGNRNQGFWYDFIVNQHILFYFDRKLPRDSIPNSLPLALGALAGRLFPWLLFLPAAIPCQWQAASTSRRPADFLPLTWPVMLVAFFTLSSSRLHHYYIPVVPASALLAGMVCARWSRATAPRTIPALLVGLGGAGLLAALPGILQARGDAALAPALLSLGRAIGWTLLTGGTLAATLMAARRPAWSAGALIVTFLAFGGLALRGFAAAEPLLSVRPLVRRLTPAVVEGSRLVYETGPEYQLVGATCFYLRREVELLRPPGYVSPTYLEPYSRQMFIERDTLWDEWARGRRRILLFTDRNKRVDRPAEFPRPFYVLDRGAGRLVLTNLPLTDLPP